MNGIRHISFKNYKVFTDLQVMELHPITLLIGKNSSGKSSILKLIAMLQMATRGDFPQLRLSNNNISLGSRYQDLIHNHELVEMTLGLCFDNGIGLEASYALNNGILYRYKLEVSSNGNVLSTSAKPDEETGLINKDILSNLGIDAREVTFSLDYIGPIRREANRTYEYNGYSDNEELGYLGENSYAALLGSFLRDKTLYNNVSTWMEKHLEGQKLVIEQVNPASGTFSFFIDRDGCKVNITDVGEGVSQLLPIIVEAFLDNKMDVVAIEQPELHIHPADHADIASLLAESALRYGKKYLIETHSENFLLGLREMVSDKNSPLKPEDVVVYFIDKDEQGSYLQKIEISDDGQLSSWPEGVFGEGFELISKIMKNQGSNDN